MGPRSVVIAGLLAGIATAVAVLVGAVFLLPEPSATIAPSPTPAVSATIAPSPSPSPTPTVTATIAPSPSPSAVASGLPSGSPSPSVAASIATSALLVGEQGP